MARYTITVSDNKAAAILKYLKEQEGVKVEAQYEITDEEMVLHDWHKDLIDERLKSVKEHPESIISEEEMNNRIKKYLKK